MSGTDRERAELEIRLLTKEGRAVKFDREAGTSEPTLYSWRRWGALHQTPYSTLESC